MCIVCTNEYDQNTTGLLCCKEVTEIPVLPNLTHLWCRYTKVTEIPVLPNLTTLYCYNTKVTEIPLLPNLTTLYCYNTKVTEIPLLPNLTTLCCTNTGIKYISDIYKNIYISSNTEIIFYNDYQLRKFQKNYRKRQFLKIIDMLPMHTNISRYLVLPEMMR